MSKKQLVLATSMMLAGFASGSAQALTGVYTGGQSEDTFLMNNCSGYNSGGLSTGCPFPTDESYDTALGGLDFEAWAHVDGNWQNQPTHMGSSFNTNAYWSWDFDQSGSMDIDRNLDMPGARGPMVDGHPENTGSNDGAEFHIDYDAMLYLGQGHHYDANSVSGIPWEVDGFQLTINSPWTVHNRLTGIPIVDNNDGTYTGYLEFQVNNAGFGAAVPHAWLEITWAIEDDGMGGLTMTTLDSDGNGYPGAVPGDPANGDFAGFPFPFEPRWNGMAYAVPEPSIVALMLGGLGMVGFMAMRRRNQA
jgi:hypothetical protein